jgi:DNA helicase-2/ATP-dependent DNA helicase PcrA
LENKPSIYQKIVFNKFRNSISNLIISAVAGSGKTTTIINCIDFIPKGKDTIFFAFNNHIVKELQSKITRYDVRVSTLHSFCWRALQNNYKGKKLILNKNKAYKYAEKIIRKNSIPKNKQGAYYYSILSLSDLVRQNLLVGNILEIEKLAEYHDIWYDKLSMEMLTEVLNQMDNDKTEMDYTDMIYRSIKENVRFETFDFVFVDESQDLSKMQQEVIRRSKKSKGRLIAVGDEMQSIYGFAGADSNSYKTMKKLFDNTEELKLSISYRCSQSVIKEAQKYNEQILPFKDNVEGVVEFTDFEKIKSGDWVICRNVKPLVYTNLYLISKEIKSFIKGAEIGAGLIQIVNRNDSDTIGGMLKNYSFEIEKQMDKLKKLGMRKPQNSEKVDKMNQTYDILDIISRGLISTKALNKKIKEIFKEGGDGVMLSTIHKTKGLENKNIYFLCPELLPSRFATKQWQIEQENNLNYVAVTRAKENLYYISEKEYKFIEAQFKN